VRKLDLSFRMAARKMSFREFFALRAATGLEIQAQIQPTRTFHTVSLIFAQNQNGPSLAISLVHLRGSTSFCASLTNYRFDSTNARFDDHPGFLSSPRLGPSRLMRLVSGRLCKPFQIKRCCTASLWNSRGRIIGSLLLRRCLKSIDPAITKADLRQSRARCR
jgi:hypothetical protein